MKSKDRKKLEKFALEQLDATADDKERWSFAWGGKGYVCLSYCPWSETEEFAGGMFKGLDLPWSEQRRELIERGEADLTEDESRQWRQVMAQRLAANGEAYTVWIAPVTIDQIAGYAVFLFDNNAAPEDPPTLEGIFDSLGQAKDALLAKGAVFDPKLCKFCS
jgi:hypothetical protein